LADLLDGLRSALAGRYAIERELGAGGMATVFLAEDLKHHRKVALKVLRPELAATIGASRFSREIDVAAQLQHPNILPLLDSGEAGGLLFYVMPYVEGESLRDRLARGGELPVPEAVRILMEVADALSHAHAHGVIHRDIKPDNVLLAGRHALVADFGVAKAVSVASEREGLTATGVALGTPAYMAPEQATADPLQDHRLDIYALGVLGYEMLTGRAPFVARTAQELLAAQVTREPEPVERYRPAVPPALAAVVMKCLAKNPADRWQTADELLAQLEPLATPSGGTTATRTRAAAAAGRLRPWLRWVGGAAALAVVALVATQLFRGRPLAVTASGITQITSDPQVEFQPAISPDGNEVAYVAGPIGAPHLAIRSAAHAGEGGELRLAAASPGSQWLPSWTPDGQSVRFWSCPPGTPLGSYAIDPACRLEEAGKFGGPARRVAAAQGGWPALSPDGARVAFVRQDTIFTALASGEDVRRVAVQPRHGRIALHSLSWSPDGRRIAYVEGNAPWLTGPNVDVSSIWVVDAAGGTPRQITGGDQLNVSPAWLDARQLLFVSNRDGPRGVYVVEVGPDGARGAPRPVPGVADPHSISVSSAGRRLAVASFTVHQNIWSYPLGRSAPVSVRDGTPVTTGNQFVEEHDVSQDGSRIVYASNRRGNLDLYTKALPAGEATALTTSPGDEDGPAWSPDGREVAYYSIDPGSTGQIWVLPSDGGTPVNLSNSPTMNTLPRWRPDGHAIAFYSLRQGQYHVWLAARDSVGGAWRTPVELTDFMSTICDWAPDGGGFLSDWTEERGWSDVILILVGADGRVSRRAVPAASVLRLDRGSPRRFSRDGGTIYGIGTHRDGRRGVWAIPVAGGTPRLVVAFDDPAITPVTLGGGIMSLGPDRLYLTVAQYESDIWVANLRW